MKEEGGKKGRVGGEGGGEGRGGEEREGRMTYHHSLPNESHLIWRNKHSVLDVHLHSQK